MIVNIEVLRSSTHYWLKDLAAYYDIGTGDVLDLTADFVDRWWVDSTCCFDQISDLRAYLHRMDVGLGEVSVDVSPKHREAFLASMTDSDLPTA